MKDQAIILLGNVGASDEAKSLLMTEIEIAIDFLVDISQLRDRLNELEYYSEEVWTPETWDYLQQEAIYAQGVLDDPEATDEMVITATNRLSIALDGLIPVSGPGGITREDLEDLVSEALTKSLDKFEENYNWDILQTKISQANDVLLSEDPNIDYTYAYHDLSQAIQDLNFKEGIGYEYNIDLYRGEWFFESRTILKGVNYGEGVDINLTYGDFIEGYTYMGEESLIFTTKKGDRVSFEFKKEVESGAEYTAHVLFNHWIEDQPYPNMLDDSQWDTQLTEGSLVSFEIPVELKDGVLKVLDQINDIEHTITEDGDRIEFIYNGAPVITIENVL